MRVSNNAGELVYVGRGGSADVISSAQPLGVRGRNAMRGAAVRLNPFADPTGDTAVENVFAATTVVVTADEIKAMLAAQPKTLQLANINGDLYDVEYADAASWLNANRRTSVR